MGLLVRFHEGVIDDFAARKTRRIALWMKCDVSLCNIVNEINVQLFGYEIFHPAGGVLSVKLAYGTKWSRAALECKKLSEFFLSNEQPGTPHKMGVPLAHGAKLHLLSTTMQQHCNM